MMGRSRAESPKGDVANEKEGGVVLPKVGSKRTRSAEPAARAAGGPAAKEDKSLVEAVRKRMGNEVLTLRERLLIVFVSLQLRSRKAELEAAERERAQRLAGGEPARKHRKTQDRKGVVFDATHREVAALLGFAYVTVLGVLGPFYKAVKAGRPVVEVLDTVGVAAPRGNRLAKTKRIRPTRAIARLVRNYVRERRDNEQQVNAAHVTRLLIENEVLTNVGKLPDGSFEPKALATAQRRVRALLIRLGYKRGKRVDGQLEEKPHHIEIWQNYLETVQANRELPLDQRKCEVYLGESYCHNYHPNDRQHKQKVEKHEGRRYCFAAAIRGAIPDDRSSKAAYLPKTLWMFAPQNVKANTDYHKTFNSKNFSEWWTSQLLPNVPKKSLIIMDGASYHVAADPLMPDANKMEKASVIKMLKDDYNVDSNPKDYAKDLKVRLKAFLNGRYSFHLERLTREFNEANGTSIAIVLTPPYLSDLQPIERVWAFVKNHVAREYKDGTTMKEVEQRLRARFDLLANDTGQHRGDGITYVQAFINTANKHFEHERQVLAKRLGGPPAEAEPQFVGVEDDDVPAAQGAQRIVEGEWDSDAESDSTEISGTSDDNEDDEGDGEEGDDDEEDDSGEENDGSSDCGDSDE